MGSIQSTKFLLSIFSIFAACGSGNSHYFRHLSTLPTILKEFPASVPISLDYNIEILKPMGRMEEQRRIPLFLIPQTAFHIFPNYGDNTHHLPAIEIPLAEPMILRRTESEVVAPIGFTAYFHGRVHPFYTYVLLAPIPSNTFVSDETPVVINVIYALPKVSYLPTSHQVITKFPKTVHSEQKLPLQPSVVESTPKPINQSTDEDTVSLTIPMEELPIPFENSKESPYLQEMRIESLQRQVNELQDQIRKIKRLRN